VGGGGAGWGGVRGVFPAGWANDVGLCAARMATGRDDMIRGCWSVRRSYVAFMLRSTTVKKYKKAYSNPSQATGAMAKAVYIVALLEWRQYGEFNIGLSLMIIFIPIPRAGAWSICLAAADIIISVIRPNLMCSCGAPIINDQPGPVCAGGRVYRSFFNRRLKPRRVDC